MMDEDLGQPIAFDPDSVRNVLAALATARVRDFMLAINERTAFREQTLANIFDEPHKHIAAALKMQNDVAKDTNHGSFVVGAILGVALCAMAGTEHGIIYLRSLENQLKGLTVPEPEGEPDATA